MKRTVDYEFMLSSQSKHILESKLQTNIRTNGYTSGNFYLGDCVSPFIGGYSVRVNPILGELPYPEKHAGSHIPKVVKWAKKEKQSSVSIPLTFMHFLICNLGLVVQN